MDNEYLELAEMEMDEVIENFENNLKTIRTGRASASMLDRVRVDYYGEMTPINQMAKISVLEGTQLVIKPYDRSTVKSINHAIAAANLGVTPQAEADLIRINVPPLTTDRRKQLAKEAKKYADEAKVNLRNIRRNTNDKIKKDKEIPEDMSKEWLDDCQKLTDKYVKKVDTLEAAKESDLLG
ncbi:ribosome recycling factor [Allobaculum mucilyticum]|uniref:ribosome recycling factor n=1 Tax=Allobaculum mucilyticum TaxID=2834459 RepID=UPI001E3286B3|nr:ribosome recycling factor [Allobaculum mucilyticum]UNT95758.1 ribosome recycling factor [Allobaculum mucilyticum]